MVTPGRYSEIYETTTGPDGSIGFDPMVGSRTALNIPWLTAAHPRQLRDATSVCPHSVQAMLAGMDEETKKAYFNGNIAELMGPDQGASPADDAGGLSCAQAKCITSVRPRSRRSECGWVRRIRRAADALERLSQDFLRDVCSSQGS